MLDLISALCRTSLQHSASFLMMSKLLGNIQDILKSLGETVDEVVDLTGYLVENQNIAAENFQLLQKFIAEQNAKNKNYEDAIFELSVENANLRGRVDELMKPREFVLNIQTDVTTAVDLFDSSGNSAGRLQGVTQRFDMNIRAAQDQFTNVIGDENDEDYEDDPDSDGDESNAENGEFAVWEPIEGCECNFCRNAFLKKEAESKEAAERAVKEREEQREREEQLKTAVKDIAAQVQNESKFFVKTDVDEQARKRIIAVVEKFFNNL